jgi:16S rRNA (adenine1518-N6/adenine1519-N6)-dimethyltransferase
MKNKKNFETKKEKEQHFLVNYDILNKEILISKINNNEDIIEIGAGDGRLTKLIAKKANFVLTFEKDASLKNLIEKNLYNFKNIKIIYDDALKYSWNGFDKIVSNIPYSLSWPILEKAIKEDIYELVLIVGEKFKKKLESQEKIGFISNLFFDIQFLLEIKKENFNPIPRTDSWLVHLKKKNSFNERDEILKEILLSKKKLKNALIYSLSKRGFTKKELKTQIKNFNLNENSLNKQGFNASLKFLIKIKEFIEFFENKKIIKK